MNATAHDEPFRHWIVRDVVPPDVIRYARKVIPPADRPEWIRYGNPLECNKWAMEDAGGLPFEWQHLLAHLESAQWLAALETLTGVRRLQVDPGRRGAGLHLMFPGGWLGCHVDYALHPCGLERRVNVIVFLDECDPRHGGGLQLCDPFGVPVTTLYPRAGEAVVWECGDEAYHAVEPLAADAPTRVTAAAYYLAPPRPNCTRRRALFLPRR